MAKKSHKPADLNQRMKAVVDEATGATDDDFEVEWLPVRTWRHQILAPFPSQASSKTK
jgi:hypothetical protein